jgi:hypothetical protein
MNTIPDLAEVAKMLGLCFFVLGFLIGGVSATLIVTYKTRNDRKE